MLFSNEFVTSMFWYSLIGTSSFMEVAPPRKKKKKSIMFLLVIFLNFFLRVIVLLPILIGFNFVI